MISLSGVLSPGPMTAAAIQQGGRSGFAGTYIAIGHGLVELPLILFIFLGASSLLQLEWVRILIGVAGGIYLLFIGKGLLIPKVDEEVIKEGRMTSPFYSGMLLSIGNPYFLLWWGTIGVGLVISAVRFGFIGLILFALFHWLCDLLWYSFLSIASFKGVKMFGAGLYRKVSIFCGFVMLFYGGAFILSSLKFLLWVSLPITIGNHTPQEPP